LKPFQGPCRLAYRSWLSRFFGYGKGFIIFVGMDGQIEYRTGRDMGEVGKFPDVF
jgi:hypothetical protein